VMWYEVPMKKITQASQKIHRVIMQQL